MECPPTPWNLSYFAQLPGGAVAMVVVPSKSMKQRLDACGSWDSCRRWLFLFAGWLDGLMSKVVNNQILMSIPILFWASGVWEDQTFSKGSKEPPMQQLEGVWPWAAGSHCKTWPLKQQHWAVLSTSRAPRNMGLKQKKTIGYRDNPETLNVKMLKMNPNSEVFDARTSWEIYQET